MDKNVKAWHGNFTKQKSDPYTIEGLKSNEKSPVVLLEGQNQLKKPPPYIMRANIGNLPPDIINLNIYVIKKHPVYYWKGNIGIV